ncbi:MAG: hypothetical protein KAS17_10980 [Victivallaceae bacterium]|nr:hypothetical protein [Victivallaceae bacterium]
MNRQMTKRRSSKVTITREALAKLIYQNRCEAVELYKDYLIIELTAMSTPKQLDIVERAIKRIEGFI